MVSFRSNCSLSRVDYNSIIARACAISISILGFIVVNVAIVIMVCCAPNADTPVSCFDCRRLGSNFLNEFRNDWFFFSLYCFSIDAQTCRELQAVFYVASRVPVIVLGATSFTCDRRFLIIPTLLTVFESVCEVDNNNIK